MNSLEYLLSESDDAVLRGGVTLRKLDPNKVQGEDRYYWQVVNVTVPVILVIVFGILQHVIRQKRYMKTN